MSSELSQEAFQPIKKLNPKRKFVRSSSLERFKEITYNCSQNYYFILPALLAWVKSSQNVLESCIFCTKMAITTVMGQIRISYITATRELSNLLFKACIYLTILAIFAQLAVCLYLLSSAFVPAGLLFLITCLYLISHINYKCLNFFLEQVEKDKMATSDKVKLTRISRNRVLGKRTISDFNLL